MITGNEPANAIVYAVKINSNGAVLEQDVFTGLTIRQQFAMAAMQGMLANAAHAHLLYPSFAREAVKIADSLISELNKPVEP